MRGETPLYLRGKISNFLPSGVKKYSCSFDMKNITSKEIGRRKILCIQRSMFVSRNSTDLVLSKESI